MKLSAADLEKPLNQVFQTMETLGKGSFGSVYKGKKISTEELVAMKQVMIDSDLKEILKEIKIMKECECEFVVRYYGSFYEDPHLWIIIEFCEAGSISDMMKACKTALNEQQIILVMRDTLEGLKFIHMNRKIHRDIKAGNILVTSKGRCKLADFGVSGTLTDKLSKRNTVIGTPYWMAPEVLSEVGYDHMADIWSLGITCIEMATFYPPFSDDPPMKVLFMIPKNPPPTINDSKGAKGKTFSANFKDFISSCLVKDPQKRSSATELTHHIFLKHAVPMSEMVKLVQFSLETRSKSNQKNNSTLNMLDDFDTLDSDDSDIFKTASPGVLSNLNDSTIRHNPPTVQNFDQSTTRVVDSGSQEDFDTKSFNDSSIGTACYGTSDIGTVAAGYCPTFMNIAEDLATMRIGGKSSDDTNVSAFDKEIKVPSVIPVTGVGRIDIDFLSKLSISDLKKRLTNLENDKKRELEEISRKYKDKIAPIESVMMHQKRMP